MQDDIAVIGFALRFPQDAVTPESFWQMLLEGRLAATEVPESRFNVEAFYHPDPDRLGSVGALLRHNQSHYIRHLTCISDELPWRQFSARQSCCIRCALLFDITR